MGSKRLIIAVAGVTAAALALSRPALGLLVDMAGHWSAPLVGALEARGIISGDEQGRFQPEASLTRAQLAKLLVTSLNYQDDARLLAGYASRYSDVPRWHWANGYIASAAEFTAMEGYPDGSFGPEEPVTRAQLAVIAVRIMGLADQARLMRFERTAYADDQAIADWARGSVRVAQAAGLMEGFEDGTFRPNQPITRAEGSAALFRMLSLKGQIFSLTGTLVRFDAAKLGGTVRDELGQERTFTMSPDARYFRGGVATTAAQESPLDQVWVVQGPDGLGTFMDARFRDLQAADLRVSGSSVSVNLADGSARTFKLEPGTLAFRNGQPTTPDQLNGATAAYLVLDFTGTEVRVLDAVTVSVRGRLVGLDLVQSTMYLGGDGANKAYTLAQDAVVIVNGVKSKPTDLRLGDQVQLVQNDAGAVTYMIAER